MLILFKSEVKAVLLLLVVPAISKAGDACIVRFVEGKMIKHGKCEHDITAVLGDIQRRAVEEIGGPVGTTESADKVSSSRPTTSFPTTSQRGMTTAIKRDCLLTSNRKCFTVKLSKSRNVNLTIAKEICKSTHGRLADITERQAIELFDAIRKRQILCEDGSREFSSSLTQVFTGLTYKNKTVFDSLGKTVVIKSFLAQVSQSDSLAVMLDICNESTKRMIRGVEKSMLLRGAVCEILMIIRK